MQLLKGFTECVGAEIELLDEGLYHCKWIHLSRSGSGLDISGPGELVGPIVEVVNALPKVGQVALVLSGRGVLSRSLETAGEGVKGQQVFQTAFPGVAAEEFYTQHLFQQPRSFISIARKQLVDPLLGKLESAGIGVLSLSLGPAVGVHLLEQIFDEDREVEFNGYRFLKNEKNELAEMEKLAVVTEIGPIKIGEVEIPSDCAFAYSAGLQLLLGGALVEVKADVPILSGRLADFLDLVRFRKGLTILLGAVFVLLLMSYLLLSYYSAENSLLSGRVGNRERKVQSEQQLSEKLADAEKKLKLLGWNGGYSPAMLLDQMSSVLPAQLSFLSVEFSPVLIEQDGFGSISVAGKSGSLQSLNNWLHELKKLTWVKQVKLVSYEIPQDQEVYHFKVLLNY